MFANFDLCYRIEPNPGNIFMVVFIDLWPCLFTTEPKLSFSSEVTLIHTDGFSFLCFIRIFLLFHFFGEPKEANTQILILYTVYRTGPEIITWSHI